MAGPAARRYVAGAGVADAVAVCRRYGGPTTLCFWDAPGERPAAVAARCAATAQAASRAGLASRLSLKAPALGLDRALVARVVAESRLPVHFDAHGHDEASAILDLARRAADSAPTGCTLPGRWRRSVEDADEAVGAGLHVRLVKGQWEAPAGAACDARGGFLELARVLAGRATGVSVATHDAALAGEAIALLRGAGTPCELELLLGLPMRRATAVAGAAGVPVRVYVPFGHPQLPYSPRRIPREPRIAAWLARDLALAVAGRGGPPT